ncbi:MAG: NUDIX domain-containing protein [Campylobacterales bacterium]
MKKWKVLSEVFTIDTKWVSFIYERVKDEKENTLDYYRVKRADSVVIIPMTDDRLLLPRAYYRHGVGKITLDFPGGRVESGENPVEKSKTILLRELGIGHDEVLSIEMISDKAFLVDSSFSSQRLYISVARLATLKNHDSVDISRHSVDKLLKDIDCLQCRFALLELVKKIGV